MLDYLQQPYPVERNPGLEFLALCGIGVFVAGFLIVFQPFGTYEYRDPNENLLLAGYGVVVSGVLLLNRFGLPRLLPTWFEEEKWTVGRHILWVLGAVVAAILACHLYWLWYFNQPFDWRNLWGFLGMGASIAVFPVTGLVLADYIRRLRRNQRKATNVNAQLQEHRPAQPISLLRLCDENGREQLEVMPQDLLYLQSADNYIEAFFLKDDQVQRLLFRNSLKEMEDQLPDPPFLRCHRSYLINLDRVAEVSGNAQGYKLYLPPLEVPLPVARSRSRTVLDRLEGS